MNRLLKYLFCLIVVFVMLFDAAQALAEGKCYEWRAVTYGDGQWTTERVEVECFRTFLETAQSYMGNNAGCWYCSAFKVFFDAINSVSSAVATNLSYLFLAVLGVGILFLIAFKVGKMVVQLQEVDVMQFLGDLFKPLGRALIAGAILIAPVEIFRYTVSPILTAGLAVSAEIQETGNAGLSIFKTVTDKDKNDNIKIISSDGLSKKLAAAKDDLTQALSPQLWVAMEYNLQTISSSLTIGLATASYLMYLAGKDLLWFVLPNFPAMIYAAVMWVIFFLIYISYPFKLIDAMVRLAFVCALMPLWVMLWVFPTTAGFAKKALDNLIHVAFLFVTLSVVLVVIFQILNYTFIVDNPNTFYTALFKIENQGAVESFLETHISFSAKGVFMMLAMGLLALKLLNMAVTFANSFMGLKKLGLNTASMTATLKMSGKVVGAAGAVGNGPAGLVAGAALAGPTAGMINLMNAGRWGTKAGSMLGRLTGNTSAAAVRRLEGDEEAMGNASQSGGNSQQSGGGSASTANATPNQSAGAEQMAQSTKQAVKTTSKTAKAGVNAAVDGAEKGATAVGAATTGGGAVAAEKKVDAELDKINEKIDKIK